jgi:hypothetical protein
MRANHSTFTHLLDIYGSEDHSMANSAPSLSHEPVPQPPSSDEHYKLLLDDVHVLAGRRETINDLFLGIVTLVLGAEAYLFINASDGDIRTMVLIVAASIYGLLFCRIWRRTLENYSALLSFRFFVLKEWERDWFPEEQRYYTAEDILYDAKLRQHPPTKLGDAYVKQLGGRRIPPFVNVYRLLPTMASIALATIAAVRILLLVSYYAVRHLPLITR